MTSNLSALRILILFRFLVRRRSAKIAYTHHFSLHFGVWWADLLGRIYEAFLRRVATHCDVVIITTEDYALTFKKPGMHLIVAPWGYDKNRFTPATREYNGKWPLRVIAIGQFRWYKGMDVAVSAVLEQPELSLSLVGSGPMLSSVLASIPTRATNVRYLGQVSDSELPDVIRDHDVIILPSRTRLEAFGIVLIEGMACGCVPVASRLPGVRKVIGDAGLTTVPGCEKSLRETLLALARDPNDTRRRKEAAIQRAKLFTWERTVDEYESIFRQLTK